MAKQTLRRYQTDAVQELRQLIRDGYRRILLVAATGSGKTTVACYMINSAAERDHRSIFLAHRKELIDQCSARLDGEGVDHGIIKAGNKRIAPHLPVQVASVLTLIKREKPEAKIFIIDEAHRARAKSYMKVLESYPDSIVIGLTATPYRLDGKGLGDIFETIAQVSSVAELTQLGFLVPARVFSTPMMPSMKKVHKKRGDYDAKETADIVDRQSIIGDICGHWKKHAPGRCTICFAVTRVHARHIQDAFILNGVSAGYVDGSMRESQREEELARLASGHYDIMVNVGILTEGYDLPKVSCIILARPTASTALYLQMAGRGLRPWDNKTDCIILDHGGNTHVHGFVEDDRVYDLEGLKKADSNAEKTVKIKTCEECFNIYKGTVCPECGHVNKTRDNQIKEEDGDLVELKFSDTFNEQKAYFYRCLMTQKQNGYKESYAAVRYKERYGRWPGKMLGVNPKWRRDPLTKKSKIDGFDSSEALRDAEAWVKKQLMSEVMCA